MSLVRFTNQTPSVFDRLFEGDLFDRTNSNFLQTNTTLPSVNIKENTNEFKVELAVPGFNKDDFQLKLNQDLLTISLEKKVASEAKDGERFTKREFSYQSFSRSFTLPDTADSERIHASYENGILVVSIPKKEETKTKPSRLIEIN